MNRVRLNTSIDPDVLRKLRIYAATNGMCMNEVIEKAIIFYLKYKDGSRVKG